MDVWTDGSPGGLLYRNRLRDQESFHHKYLLPSSRDMESYVSSVGRRERERDRQADRQADRKPNILKTSVEQKHQNLCSHTVQKCKRPVTRLPTVGSLKLTLMGVLTL